MEIALLICNGVIIILVVVVLWRVIHWGGVLNLDKYSDGLKENEKQIALVKENVAEGNRQIMDHINRLSEMNGRSVSALRENMTESLDRGYGKIEDSFGRIRTDMDGFRKETEKQLVEMNRLVTEKMQSILDRKLNDAFNTIVKNMSDLGKGLNDAQNRQQTAIVESLSALGVEFKSIRDAVIDSMNNVQSILDRKLNEAFDTIVKNMSDLGKGLNEAQDRQQKATGESIASLETEFTCIRRDILDSMEKSRQDNAESLEKLQNEFTGIRGDILNSMEKTRSGNAESLDKLRTEFSGIRGDILNSMEKIRNGNSESLDRLQTEFIGIRGDILNSMEKTRNGNAESLDKLQTEFTGIREDILNSMEKTRNGNAESLDKLQTEFTVIRGDILNSMEKVQVTLDRKLNEAFHMIVKNMSDLGKGLNDAQDRQQLMTVEHLKNLGTEFNNIREAFLSSMDSVQGGLDRKLNGVFETVVKNMSELGKGLNDGQERHQKATVECLESLEQAFCDIREDLVNALDKIRKDNAGGLDRLRAENQASLDKINETVNEKLQKTLNDRISQSFELVNKRLTEVYEGLGEMKSVASGVSDLKNVLSNVKSRGIMGEIQLGSILGDILSPDQYETQFKMNPDSSELVDFAVRLPGLEDGKYVYLPIDSKFPGETYAKLVEAYDKGDPVDVKQKRKLLEDEIKRCASSIQKKYIVPPYSTDFAIMFLPFEGVYAEVVNMGLVNELQRNYRVNITGPSTMAAMLNSLQMGFRTLAIQKKSGEVWKILEAAKKEFSNFENVLNKTRDRLRQADDELEKLIGTRTRAINRKLKTVSELEDGENSEELLELT